MDKFINASGFQIYEILEIRIFPSYLTHYDLNPWQAGHI